MRLDVGIENRERELARGEPISALLSIPDYASVEAHPDFGDPIPVRLDRLRALAQALLKLDAECRRLGIPVRPPDVNLSGRGFTVERDADGALAIRYGLSAIKNVGEGVVQAIIEARAGQPGGRFEGLEALCAAVERAVQAYRPEGLTVREVVVMLEQGPGAVPDPAPVYVDVYDSGYGHGI